MNQHSGDPIWILYYDYIDGASFNKAYASYEAAQNAAWERIAYAEGIKAQSLKQRYKRKGLCFADAVQSYDGRMYLIKSCVQGWKPTTLRAIIGKEVKRYGRTRVAEALADVVENGV
jgi:hypothetical protein